jgi:hypothetical protein
MASLLSTSGAMLTERSQGGDPQLISVGVKEIWGTENSPFIFYAF